MLQRDRALTSKRLAGVEMLGGYQSQLILQIVRD